MLDDHFDTEGALDPRWSVWRPSGRVEVARSAVRFALDDARAGVYSDAQIDDYTITAPAYFRWRPPLRMVARARASQPAHPASDVTPEEAGVSAQAASRFRFTPFDPNEPMEGGAPAGSNILSPATPVAETPDISLTTQPYLLGTFGFGFWNAPVALRRLPRLPDAIWFFGASLPSNMALVPGVAGWGWKAQVVHANRPGAVLAGAPAVGAALWARLSGSPLAYNRAARWTRRVTGAQEASLDALVDLRDWHEYTLEWRHDVARFWVDDAEALVAPLPPQGPLGFVAWLDNQYAIATPLGELRFGTLTTGPQWFELDYLRITPL
ncbi:MAG TPA: hypothetical protein VKQ36_13385 [Ktedonobacterales bacterium]|nr:hypothetical protein [Ktedonobacterales bacterium]